MDEQKPHLSVLGKCALAASFLFAIGIWFFVAESDSSLVAKQPAPRPTPDPQWEPHSPPRLHHPEDTSFNPGRRKSKQTRLRDEVMSGAISRAAKDPSSMFDMSTP
mmetsp:Transcript_64000/g.106403  ORF Transcript_64000/g.106403 Transcript_64000/m.106403 type:complete len:106 (+) Transcript_64000:89-406(+)